MELTFINSNIENYKNYSYKESVKQRAQEIYNSVMTQNPNFNQYFLQGFNINTQGLGKMNGFLLYSRLLKEHFWILNPHVSLQRIRKSADGLLWRNLQESEKLYFNKRAEEINIHNGKTKRESKKDLLFHEYSYEKKRN
jgi:hypothetical protein